MKLTPAIKGQLTRVVKAGIASGMTQRQAQFNAYVPFFMATMPREQAKHAARKYLAKV